MCVVRGAWCVVRGVWCVWYLVCVHERERVCVVCVEGRGDGRDTCHEEMSMPRYVDDCLKGKHGDGAARNGLQYVGHHPPHQARPARLPDDGPPAVP